MMADSQKVDFYQEKKLSILKPNSSSSRKKTRKRKKKKKRKKNNKNICSTNFITLKVNVNILVYTELKSF